MASSRCPLTRRAAASIGRAGRSIRPNRTLSERPVMSGLMGSTAGVSMRVSDITLCTVPVATPTGSSRRRASDASSDETTPAAPRAWRTVSSVTASARRLVSVRAGAPGSGGIGSSSGAGAG